MFGFLTSANRRYQRLVRAFDHIADVPGDVVVCSDDQQILLMLQYLAELEARDRADHALRSVHRTTAPGPIAFLYADSPVPGAIRAQLAPGGVVVRP